MTLPCGKALDWPPLFALSFMIVSRKCVLAVFSVHMLARLSQYLARSNWKQKKKNKIFQVIHPLQGRPSPSRIPCINTWARLCVDSRAMMLRLNKRQQKKRGKPCFFSQWPRWLVSSSPFVDWISNTIAIVQVQTPLQQFHVGVWLVYLSTSTKKKLERTKEKKKRPRKEKGQRKCVFSLEKRKEKEYILLHISFALLYIGNHCVF